MSRDAVERINAPGYSNNENGDGGWDYTPLKSVSTVRKYDPMGNTIMPRVKARSFMMTELSRVCMLDI